MVKFSFVLRLLDERPRRALAAPTCGSVEWFANGDERHRKQDVLPGNSWRQKGSKYYLTTTEGARNYAHLIVTRMRVATPAAQQPAILSSNSNLHLCQSLLPPNRSLLHLQISKFEQLSIREFLIRQFSRIVSHEQVCYAFLVGGYDGLVFCSSRYCSFVARVRTIAAHYHWPISFHRLPE
jgi:hypothetical protein